MNNRPVLHIPKTALEKWHDWISVLLLLAAMGYLAFVGPQLPEIIPTHVNGSGDVNGWGNKWVLLLMPLLSIVLFIGFTVLSKFPHTFNYRQAITEENAFRQYRMGRLVLSWVKLFTVVLFTGIEWFMIQLAFS
ncbi:hypothetical protein EL26_17755 [Tumebacillus flagellatus]|uniref:DUF1648 domain-containing protein n=2 Tax=Tumebacillus flagellatus TaxID=1157490 RepID=A0A074LNC6_9BACL|nr:hypothetical protein EL26_17755 [Tumebacillus flagellatus]